MIKVAIVEDNERDVLSIRSYLEQFGREHSMAFGADVFHDGNQLTFDYKPVYDILLMDIEMPVMVCVGVSTLANVKKWNWKDVVEGIPAIACAVAAVLFSNLVAGVACGVVLYVVLASVFAKKGRHKVELANLVLLALMIAVMGMTFGMA